MFSETKLCVTELARQNLHIHLWVLKGKRMTGRDLRLCFANEYEKYSNVQLTFQEWR